MSAAPGSEEGDAMHLEAGVAQQPVQHVERAGIRRRHRGAAQPGRGRWRARQASRASISRQLVFLVVRPQRIGAVEVRTARAGQAAQFDERPDPDRKLASSAPRRRRLDRGASGAAQHARRRTRTAQSTSRSCRDHAAASRRWRGSTTAPSAPATDPRSKRQDAPRKSNGSSLSSTRSIVIGDRRRRRAHAAVIQHHASQYLARLIRPLKPNRKYSSVHESLPREPGEPSPDHAKF